MRIAVTYENGQIFQHFGRTEQYYKVRPCVKFVRTAAEILDRYLEENPPMR